MKTASGTLSSSSGESSSKLTLSPSPSSASKTAASPATETEETALVGMIAALDAEAFEKASKIVKKRFMEQLDLDDVPELRAEYRKKLSSLELQLSGMVQVKLDGAKRAMDVIQAADDQMVAVRGEFEGMHELCRKAGEQGKLLFDAYPRLKIINRARKNLERTLKEVTYYANLPSRVDHLVGLLEEQPLQLRQVYLEGQQLELWRDELLRELKVQQRVKSPTKPPSSATATSPTRIISVGDRMQATFGIHLEEVKKLLDAIRKKIFDNISNCFEIVHEDPRILVATLEIVDMHEAFQKEKASKARERAEKNLESVEEAVALSLLEDLNADVVTKLKQKVDERASGIFAQAQAQAMQAIASKAEEVDLRTVTVSKQQQQQQQQQQQAVFSAILRAATRVLLDLTYLKADVVPCFPASYQVMDTFRIQYERHLVKEIGKLYQRGFPNLDQGELLQLMEWLSYYNQEIVNLGAVKPCSEFIQALSVCLQEYLVRVRVQMTEWFTNILNRVQEVALNSAGQPITSTPEDFFNIIHLQVLVALSKLSADNMCAVIVVCLNVIKAILEETLTTLRAKKLQHAVSSLSTKNPGGREGGGSGDDEAGGAGLTLEMLCATVNDYDRLQEKIQEFREELGRMGKLGVDQLAMVDAAVDQVLDGFVSIADEANSGCTQLILKDVREAFAEELFVPEWEENIDVMMQRVAMTFKDYYNDLSVWLPPFYFAKVVRDCLEKVVALYLFTLFRRGGGKGKEDKVNAKLRPFRDPLVVAQKIRNDRQAMTVFFNEYEEELKQAGLRETAALELQLLVLDNIVDVFEEGVTAESEVTRLLLREFGVWGVDALMVISFLRGDKDKARGELREDLTKYWEKIQRLDGGGRRGGVAGGAAAARRDWSDPPRVVSARFALSPFDSDVDAEAVVIGARRPKSRK